MYQIVNFQAKNLFIFFFASFSRRGYLYNIIIITSTLSEDDRRCRYRAPREVRAVHVFRRLYCTNGNRQGRSVGRPYAVTIVNDRCPGTGFSQGKKNKNRQPLPYNTIEHSNSGRFPRFRRGPARRKFDTNTPGNISITRAAYYFEKRFSTAGKRAPATTHTRHSRDTRK